MARTPGIDRTESLRTCSSRSSSSQTISARRSKRAGAHHHVVDLVQGRQLVGHLSHVALDRDADHGLAGEAELQRVGDGHDLHDPRLAQTLDTAAHGRLGQPDLFGDRPVGLAPVALERLDDGPVGRVEERARRPVPRSFWGPASTALIGVGHRTPRFAPSASGAEPQICRIVSSYPPQSSRISHIRGLDYCENAC